MSSVRALIPIICLALGGGALTGCGGNGYGGEEPTVEEQIGLDSREGMMELESRVEGRIRNCMEKQGFDYVPVDPFARQQALTGKARMTDADFNRQFGYGITTMFGRGTVQSDPNGRIAKGLSPQDRAAYERALWGEFPGATFQEAADTGDFSDLGGCTKEATDAAFGGAEILTALIGKLDELDQRIVQDQRMVKATANWSACMADKGYRYEESDAIDEDLLKRFKAIVGPGARAMLVSLPAGKSYDRAALTELQSEEVRVVNADLDCEKREITPVERVVRPHYEKEFREQNQSLLARVPAVGR